MLLAKNTAVTTKELVAAAVAFTKLTQQAKNMDDLRDAVVLCLKRVVRRVLSPRPRGDRDRTLHLLESLYGDPRTDEHLWTTLKSGERVKTTLLKDLEGVADCFSITPPDPEDTTDDAFQVFHYCYVDESTPDRGGRRLGQPCCDDADAVLDKAAPLINLVCGTGWKIACASRWAGVSSTFKRLCVCCTFGNLLPFALDAWLCQWGSQEI